MTVFEAWSAGRTARRPSTRTPVLTVAAGWLARRLPTWKTARSTVLQAAGLGMLDTAAYGWHHLVGYAAVGVSLLVLEWLGGER